ncbi:GNAT family N-acetyltransferase [Fluviispira vulneris]|uniref:GNAT family N-acetyltransferase n=1 Tax=Fluviispira vulneris TaxID=2763012 RepID=UPI0016448FBF|nr:GNAT family N-acetyltransferase [Fluviispira vulneris]
MQENNKKSEKLEYLIRPLEKKDLPAVAFLCEALGFAGSAIELEKRFQDLILFSHHQVRVAQSNCDGHIIGFIHFFEAPSLLSCKTLEIGALVVESNWRKQGVGKGLMLTAEQWARSKGCQSVLLATQTKRADAHQFYAKLGYEKELEAYFLRKNFKKIF